jgi:hypothetical protein
MEGSACLPSVLPVPGEEVFSLCLTPCIAVEKFSGCSLYTVMRIHFDWMERLEATDATVTMPGVRRGGILDELLEAVFCCIHSDGWAYTCLLWNLCFIYCKLLGFLC